MYALSGFGTEDGYTARRPSWEPQDELRDREAAVAAAKRWLRSQDPAAAVEVIRIGEDGGGKVVAVVVGDMVEPVDDGEPTLDPLALAARVAERLTAGGVDIDAGRVVNVMRVHAEVTGHGEPERDPALRAAAAARVAQAAGEPADVVARIFDEVDREIA